MSKNLRYFFIGLGFVILILALWYFKSIVAYILISGVLSLVGKPIVTFLNRIRFKTFKLPVAFNAAITLVFLWMVLILFFWFFIPVIASQASELSSIDPQHVIDSLDEPIKRIEQFFSGKEFMNGEQFSLESYLSSKITSILNVSFLSGIFASLTSALGDIFIAMFSISFITFFFLKDEGLFSEMILAVTPERFEDKTRHFLERVKSLLVRYFIGIGIEVILITIMVSLGLTIVGLKFSTAVVIGLFAGLMNIIPYIGPMIGASFGLIIGVASNIQLEIYSELLPLIGFMALVFLAVQLIDNIVFQPFIYSSSVNAHPLEIFLVIMLAGSLAGITGMIVAIPFYTVARVFGKEFFNNFKVVQKLTNKI